MPASAASHHGEAFGLTWAADIAMPAFHPAGAASSAVRGLPLVMVERTNERPERDVTLSLPTLRLRQICRDGARVEWGDAALLDLYCGPAGMPRLVRYRPGPAWADCLPTGFYATLAALACAWRGDVPLHASAVAWQGRAILVAGAAGAGKSTSIAAMLAAGAELVGDDLSVLGWHDGRAVIRRGRPDMRLHRDTLSIVPQYGLPHPAEDASGKWIVRPSIAVQADAVPLGAYLLLGEGEGALEPVAAATALPALLFRPRLQAAIPGYAHAMARLLATAASHPVLAAASPRDFTAAGLRAHGERLLTLARSFIERHSAAPPI